MSILVINDRARIVELQGDRPSNAVVNLLDDVKLFGLEQIKEIFGNLSTGVNGVIRAIVQGIRD